jgi:hypothetical protein
MYSGNERYPEIIGQTHSGEQIVTGIPPYLEIETPGGKLRVIDRYGIEFYSKKR